MDSTPPSNRSEPRFLRLKLASRLARIVHFDVESEDAPSPSPSPSLDLVPSSPKISSPSPSPRSQKPLPMHELLLLSPSPLRRSKTRLAERLDVAEEPVDPTGPRRRCKNTSRTGSIGLAGYASPRNNRRSRRRLEPEIREERDLGMAEEIGKVRKKRQSCRARKDRLSLVPSVPSPKSNDGDFCNLDRMGQLIKDLIMWNDVARSSLCFGFGSFCFLSSCFARGIDFSIFSMMSQLGLLFLGLSFFSNSISRRGNVENKREFKLKEDDILRAARVMLPTVNLAISKTRELFSGEPTMTLRVAPFLLIGAEYGHRMTLQRLCALGFFLSFTGPRLYCHYCVQINNGVEGLKRRWLEAWGACSHKKIVAASATIAFWNLTAIRTRILAAFMFVVILRYYRQQKVEEEEGEQEQQQQQTALVVVEKGSEK